GDLFAIQGAMIPFAAIEAERQRAGDPRAIARSALRIARPGLRDWLRRRIASSPSDYRYPRRRSAVGSGPRVVGRVSGAVGAAIKTPGLGPPTTSKGAQRVRSSQPPTPANK